MSGRSSTPVEHMHGVVIGWDLMHGTRSDLAGLKGVPVC